MSRVSEGLSVSAAAREAGVSRQTAHLWLGRAAEEGLEGMSERPRRPRSSPLACAPEVAAAVLELSGRHPYRGARKLHALLWPEGPAPVCARTVGRILARHGRTGGARPAPPEPVRFERARANELWQADFKRAGPRRARVEALCVLDDATRFCLACRTVPDQTLASLWGALWGAFGDFGLPEAILTDNGPAFRNNGTWRWSSFDLRLMLLGVAPRHGRPYHPQTQGKVERFNGTLERELGRSPCGPPDLCAFRDRYNWVRPHEALGMRTPGSVYAPSERPRPPRMPEPFFPPGAHTRRADDTGTVSFRGRPYRLGRAFAGGPVGILEDPDGVLRVVWGDFTLAELEDFRV